MVKVPPNVKPQTMRDIARVMGDKPYRIVVEKQKYGWNGLIPVVKGE